MFATLDQPFRSAVCTTEPLRWSATEHDRSTALIDDYHPAGWLRAGRRDGRRSRPATGRCVRCALYERGRVAGTRRRQLPDRERVAAGIERNPCAAGPPGGGHVGGAAPAAAGAPHRRLHDEALGAPARPDGNRSSRAPSRDLRRSRQAQPQSARWHRTRTSLPRPTQSRARTPTTIAARWRVNCATVTSKRRAAAQRPRYLFNGEGMTEGPESVRRPSENPSARPGAPRPSTGSAPSKSTCPRLNDDIE